MNVKETKKVKRKIQRKEERKEGRRHGANILFFKLWASYSVKFIKAA
jgi:hypothetical protein